MRFLSEAEYLQEAEPILRQLFVNDDPYGAIFAPEVKEKRIIYEIYTDGLFYSPLKQSIIEVATAVGDDGFYHTAIWLSATETRHYYISLAEFEHLSDIGDEDWKKIEPFPWLENVVYSPSGKWGIILSHEHYALIAGTSKTIQAIQQAIPDLDFDLQIHNFIKHWQYYSSNGCHTHWILALLTQVCGKQKAWDLLDRYDMKPMQQL